MTAAQRMTKDRIETVIEEIATTLRQFGGDERGLEIAHLRLLRPGDGGKQMYITYGTNDEQGEGTG